MSTQPISAPKFFWSLQTEALLAHLGATNGGLTDTEARERLRTGGAALQRANSANAWPRLLLAQFKNPLVLLLIGAMTLSFLLGETADALIVLSVIVLSAFLGFFQEFRAASTIAKLLALINTTSMVLRNGQWASIPASEVVPGDLVRLSAGDAVPADGALIEATDLFVDEAALSGESFPAEKRTGVSPADAPLSARSNAVFQGTHVVSGIGQAIIVHTGAQTAFGEIYQHMRRPPPETEFERGIRQFGNMLIYVTLTLVIAIFAVNIYLHKPIAGSFLFALALAVGLTPELLPAIISITLAQGAQRMAKQKVIVKRLAAIENFGSMNILCSDKTGTLTDGVVRVHSALDSRGETSEQVLLLSYLNAMFESGFVNPIDHALRQLTQFGDQLKAFSKVDEVPYDFIRKRLSVVVAQGGTHTMITKGALKNVLDACTHVQTATGVESIQASLSQITALFEHYSQGGFRVLGLATRDVSGDPIINRDDEAGMTFGGFLLLEDPLKADIGETLRELAHLGITLKIITGDNRHIAKTVGERIGLARPDVLTGDALSRMSDEALRIRARDTDIFAEVEPNQKERILKALRAAGNVVGYIGDGINDAAALHAADVGISVESAVDVAKEAADIVLLERNLKVLVQGVREGRVTFANTLKYMFTTTSANFGNMFSMAGVSLFLPFLPLLPKQILLNNFLSDLPSMAIATDGVDPEMVDRPRRWDIGFIRNFMLVFGLVSSVFDFLTFGSLLFVLNATEAQFQTGWFIESLMTELFITIVVRTRRAFFKSRPGTLLLVAVLVVAVVAIALPYTSLGALFGFVPLPGPMLAVLLLITALYLVASELVKQWFFRRFDTRAGNPTPG